MTAHAPSASGARRHVGRRRLLGGRRAPARPRATTSSASRSSCGAASPTAGAARWPTSTTPAGRRPRSGIEHHVFNFGDDFDAHVVAPYVADHAAGRTPNPCIECNRHLKFDRLLRRADALGFDAVATGHHARIVERADGTRRVARGADAAKDQCYVRPHARRRGARAASASRSAS